MDNQNEEQPAKILDWDDLSNSDKARAEELLDELNKIFDKYYPKKDKDERVTE